MLEITWPWFGMPFTSSSQETDQAIFLPPWSVHMAIMKSLLAVPRNLLLIRNLIGN